MSHSFEEIRSAAVDLLSGRETPSAFIGTPTQQAHLKAAIAELLMKRDGLRPQFGQFHELDREDDLLADEVFWDLFRQGVITPGLNNANPNFPFFRVSRLGQKILADKQSAYIHDVSSYEAALRSQVPNIEPAVLVYALEAMNAYRSNCNLSAAVMIGVASEAAFLSLLDVIQTNAKWSTTFRKVLAERQMLPKLNQFTKAVQSHIEQLPSEVREDFDRVCAGVV
jgi:hypothetical protein